MSIIEQDANRLESFGAEHFNNMTVSPKVLMNNQKKIMEAEQHPIFSDGFNSSEVQIPSFQDQEDLVVTIN